MIASNIGYGPKMALWHLLTHSISYTKSRDAIASKNKKSNHDHFIGGQRLLFILFGGHLKPTHLSLAYNKCVKCVNDILHCANDILHVTLTFCISSTNFLKIFLCVLSFPKRKIHFFPKLLKIWFSCQKTEYSFFVGGGVQYQK